MAVADRIETDIETFTIRYEDAEDDWVSAQIVEVPGAISQGRTRA